MEFFLVFNIIPSSPVPGPPNILFLSRWLALIEFMPVEDMTNAELEKELRWVEGIRAAGAFDMVLMYRFEELTDEITNRDK